ncbi:MAG: hypothetical protein SR1Q7_07220 [Quinella sp. 1Q7]|nr:hypothetical protein [Quinella sp. 1Q7]
MGKQRKVDTKHRIKSQRSDGAQPVDATDSPSPAQKIRHLDGVNGGKYNSIKFTDKDD